MAEVEGGAMPQEGAQAAPQVAQQAPEADAGQAQQDAPRTYTDAEVDAIVERKFAKWQRQQEARVAEASKLAEMNATQRAEYERDQLRKRLDEYERREAVREMADESRRQLREAGVDVPDDVVAALVGEDAEATKATVDAFAKAFNESVEAEVRRRLAGGAPRAATGARARGKAEILAIKDPMERQRAIRENMDQFK